MNSYAVIHVHTSVGLGLKRLTLSLTDDYDDVQLELKDSEL